MIGQTVSHYRILEKLGEGGMGIVYRAEDLKLKRTVAIKFLTPHLTNEREAKTRFIREAQAASALDHPHISTVHEIDEVDGQMFIVMACVEGKTLKEMIASGRLKLDESVEIAIQIADGLQEAHAKGIVHRDIKPANVMVDSRGQAKIMDFGLAKSPEETKITKTGTTLGTVAYMSPEQASGEDVDPRTDIWSLGVVLYEVITGRSPFHRVSEPGTIYAILNEEPEPMSVRRAGVPPELERISCRAISKDRTERYQHVDEFLAELRLYRKQQESGEREPASSRSTGRSKRWVLGLSGALLLAIVLGAAYLLRKSPVRLNPQATFRSLSIDFPSINTPALSSDGKWMAFPAADASGRWDVYFVNVSGGEPRRITEEPSGGIFVVDVSPDGSHIVYDYLNPEGDRREVRLVSSLGGPSRRLVTGGISPRWRPDGKRIGYMKGKHALHRSESGNREIWSIRPDGTDNRLEILEEGSVWGTMLFCWSPDGNSIAYSRTFPEGHCEVMVHDLQTGEERQATFDRKINLVTNWSSGGIITSSDRRGLLSLWLVPVNGGEPVWITKGCAREFGAVVSADGTRCVYSQDAVIGDLWVSSLDGEARRIASGSYALQAPSFSPDGTRIVAVRAGTAFVMAADGSNRREFTSGDEIVHDLQWSPDGKWIAYTSHPTTIPCDSSRAYIINPMDPGSPRTLGGGVGQTWVSATRLVVFGPAGSRLVSVDGSEEAPFFADSTHAIPILGGRHVLYKDLRPAREGVWIVEAGQGQRGIAEGSGSQEDPGFAGAPRLVLPAGYELEDLAIEPEGEFLLYAREDGELWRITLPALTEERVAGEFPGLRKQAFVAMCPGTNEIAYTDLRIITNLVLIENLFN
jgi:serine/threonine protein kinase